MATMAFRACRRRCAKIHPGSISNLCSATLGAGALSLPYAIRLTGIVFGVLLLMFSSYLTIFSIDVIIATCAKTRLFGLMRRAPPTLSPAVLSLLLTSGFFRFRCRLFKYEGELFPFVSLSRIAVCAR